MGFKYEPSIEYRVTEIYSTTIEDSYEEGQIGDYNESIASSWYSVSPSNSLTGLIENIKEELGVDEVVVYEEGIESQTMVDERGSEASPHELKLWKEGKMRLWSQEYRFSIERVSVETDLDLEEIFEAESDTQQYNKGETNGN